MVGAWAAGVAPALAGIGLALSWRPRRQAATAAGCALLALAGVLAGSHAGQPAPLARLRDHPRGLEGPWHVRGEIAREPEVTRDGSVLTLEVREVRVDGFWQAWHGRLEVTVPEPPPSPPWPRGSRLETFLALRPDRPPANPGSSTDDRLMPRGIDFRSGLKSYRQPRVRALGRNSLTLRLRQHLRRGIDAAFPQHRDTVYALILGERRLLDGDLTSAMARSGLIHLLAISGLHVGMLAGLASGATRLLGGSPRLAAYAALVATTGVLLVVVPGAPVRRAAVMAVVVLGARVAGRKTSGLDALAIAVLVLTALDPMAVRDRGAQLSVVATLSILGAGVGRGAFGLLRMSAAAQAGTAPLMALSSYRVATAGMGLNLLAVPLLGLTLPLLLGALALQSAALPGASLVAGAAAALLDTLSWLAARGASLTGSIVATPGADAITAAAWWAALVFMALRSSRARIAGAALILVAAVVAVSAPAGPRQPQLIALDVGQGDALVVRSGDEAVVADAGGYPGIDYDTGERIVLPALRHLGIARLRAVSVSHAHADHAVGVPALLDALEVEELWLGSTPPDSRYQVRALEAAFRRGTRALTPTTAARLVASCQWRALGVPVDLLLRGAREVMNDASLVSAVRCGRRALVLTGDAGAGAEAIWRVGDLIGGVLKVGHHGSLSSTTSALLSRMKPRHAVISVGHRNSFGLPRDEVLERLRASAAAVYRTDRDGALTVELGSRVRVRGERWRSGRGR